MFSDEKNTIPRVLIIEKNGALKDLISPTLNGDYQFYTASSIDQSLQMIDQYGIHGILLDIASVGREEGFLGTRRIKATNTNGKLPVIAVLPMADPGMKTDSLLAGCTTFVVQPVSSDSLDTVITEVMNLTAAFKPEIANSQA